MKFDSQQKGLALAFLASLLYTLKSAAIKFAPAAELEFFVFFRFLFDFLLLAPFFLKYRDKLKCKQPKLYFSRAIVASLSIYCSVYGIRHLTLVDAVLLENTLPLFIPLVAWVWLKQKISVSSCCILVLGFCSVFLILRPKLDILHLASFASVGTGLASATTAVIISRLSKTEHPLTILFYFNLFSLAISIMPCLYTWKGLPPFSFSFWLPFVFISFFGVLFQYAITRAYSLAMPYIAGNFSYFGVLFSALIGWLFWQEGLSPMKILGGVLLVGSGLLMIRENQRRTSLNNAASYKEITQDLSSKDQ